MTKKDVNNWIMYFEIQKLSGLGLSISRIARYLVSNPRTVSKYLQMSQQDYEDYLSLHEERTKILSCYETFVKEKLIRFQDTSTAQMRDWLLEHHPDFPKVSPRTVYNFVFFVRRKYNIPFDSGNHREYFIVEELPYGEQAQADFGEYNMRMENGSKKKVKFFTMVLTRSRMKFVWFLDTNFTAELVSIAHEKSFAFFEGIPKTIVYDQDTTMIVDENLGDIILTAVFRQYVKARKIKIHLCRKSDPESKGKIENVVGYVKKNFLYNRPYSDLEGLNTEALAWLRRTANFLPHNFTKKEPYLEHMIEKTHLTPYTPLNVENKGLKIHYVKKTNIISYKSNFYSVPIGTYKNSGTQVIVKEKEKTLEIYNLAEELICTHLLSYQKGQIVANTNHKRDNTKSLDELTCAVVLHFTNEDLVRSYLEKIRERYPRYIRDHLQVILKVISDERFSLERSVRDKSLDFCLKNDLYNAYEFEEVFHVFVQETLILPKRKTKIKLLNEANLEKANQTPQASDIETYENIINK